MGSLLVELVPYCIGMAITPSAIAVGILFLSSKHPVSNALCFAAAFAAAYSVIAALVMAASVAATEPLLTSHEQAIVDIGAGAALVLLGARKFLRSRHRDDAAASRLLTTIDDASGRAAFGLGLVLAVANPNIAFLLGGLAACTASDVAEAGRIAGSALLVAASLVGLVGPLAWYVLDRSRAQHGLGRLKAWLTLHESAVDVAVLLGFGALFVFKGLSAAS